jgi:protein-S-isoprenylcysteine O-methyltransferase Ste14
MVIFKKLIISIIWNVAIFGGLLFLPAGTFTWMRAWVFLAVVVIATILTMIGVFPGREDLLKERFKPPIQEGQPFADKIILLLFIAMFLCLIVFIPLDVFRFHLMGKPGKVVSSLGMVLFIAGWWIISLAMKENAFAAPVVKHQGERRQTVIDTGVYGIVRHPMYAGGVLLMIGMPLWLESYAAAIFTIVPIGLIVLRILVEEGLLKRELAGYEDYTRRVRYRLIPLLW